MKIRSFHVKNYKCFRETDPVKLSDGFNIVVAPNNVGKTALLEILSTRFSDKPHRTIKLPRSKPLNPKSSVTIELSVSGIEFMNIALRQSQVILPIPPDWQSDQHKEPEILKQLLLLQNIIIHCDIISTESVITAFESELFNIKDLTANTVVSVFGVNPEKDEFNYRGHSTKNIQDSLLMKVVEHFRNNTYNFLAERLNIGSCSFGANEILKSNASNLAEAIDNLQSNSARFEIFNEHVSNIFSNIHRVISRPSKRVSQHVEIVVWTVDPRSERNDLAMELQESGTGIGQVLAILYVVVNSDEPRVIIIDEPNTFLNPGAARKLVEILRTYPQHQYIFATHSPEIIRISEPGTLIAVRWEDGESKLIPIDSQNIEHLRAILIDVGAKLSDVFGADDILWVEGPTEEECFPRILRRLREQPLLGTSVVAVRTTGEFENKRPSATNIWEIYERLTSGVALLPQAIAFIFDREGRSQTEIDDLIRRSDGRVEFLPRRMYENYLIHANAIAALLNSLKTFSENPIEESTVREWLITNGGNKRYCGRAMNTGDLKHPDWLREVHGAKLLDDLVSELTENTEEFRKRSHSVWLTDWLLEHQPDAFSELRDFLGDLLPVDK